MHRIFYLFLHEDKRMKPRQMEISTAEHKQMLWNSKKSNKLKLITLEASIRAKSCLQGNNTAQERTPQLTSTNQLADWPHNTLEVSEVSTEYIFSLVGHLNELSSSESFAETESKNTNASVSEVTWWSYHRVFGNSICHCNQHLGTKDMVNSKVLMSDLITSR